MTAPIIGTAAVGVISDLTGFKRDLDTKMARINPKVKVGLDVPPVAIRQFQRDLDTKLRRLDVKLRVTPEIGPGSLTELKRNIEAWSRGSGLAGGIEVAVHPTLARGARARLQAELDGLTPPLTVRVNPILGRLDRRGLGGIGGSTTVKADVDKRSFGEALIYVNRLGSALAALAIPAAIAGAIPTILGLAAAAAQAAQSAALLPAVLGAGAFAFGAIKIGAMGFGEALKNIGDPEKFAESIASLSPAARDAALAFQGLRGPFLEMKTIVQDGLFADLAPQITALGNTYLPILTERFERITIAANSAGLDIARMLQTAEGIANVKSLGSAAAASFENLSGAVAPLAQAFLDVAQVGGTFLPGLTDGAQGAAQAFADMIRSAKESGGIATFIQEGLDALKQLGSIAGNVGSALGGVFSAGSISGGGFLTTLETITQSLADVINSTAGQNALGSFFEATSIVANTLGDTLKVIAPSLATILKAAEEGIAIIAPSIAPLAKAAGDILAAMSPLIPVIAEVGKIVAEVLTEALVELMPTIRVVVDAFAKALAPVLPVIADALKELVRALSPVVAVIGGVLADALTMIMPVLGEVAEIIADALVMALNELKPYLPQIADAFRQLMEQLIPLLPMLVQMSTEFLTAMLPALVELIPSFLDLVLAITPLLPPLTELAVTLMPLLSTVLQTTVVPALESLAFIVSNVVVPLLENILIPVLNTGIGVLTVLADTLNFLMETFNTVFGAIRQVIYDVLEATVMPLFQRVVDFIGGIFTTTVNTFKTTMDAVWSGVSTAVQTSWGFIQGVFSKMEEGVNKVRDTFRTAVGAIGSVWSSIQGTLAGPVNWVIHNVINGLIRAINKVLGIVKIPGIPELPGIRNSPQDVSGMLGFAKGGPVPGQGNKDTVPALLTPGEYVIPKPVVKRWGVPNLVRAHKAALIGNFPGLEGMFENRKDYMMPVQAFASGGLVGGQQVARAMHGTPYIWGGSSRAGTDCSGYMGMIYRGIMGEGNPFRRIWATASFPSNGFTPGLHSQFSIGNVRGSHQRGTLAGVNVESGGNTGGGATYGGRAQGVPYGSNYSLPQVGGAFIGGGAGGGGGGIPFLSPKDVLKPIFEPFKKLGGAIFGDGFSKNPFTEAIAKVPEFLVDKVIDGLANMLIGKLDAVFEVASKTGEIVKDTLEGLGGGAKKAYKATVGNLLDLWPFATGGVVNGPTRALVGENGPEAIMPLSMLAGLIKNILKTFLGAVLRGRIGGGTSTPQQGYLPAASLPGFQQIQRSDSPLRTAGSSLLDWEARIAAERQRLETRVTEFKIQLSNHGVLGSQREVERWLVESLQHLQRQGRLPQTGALAR